MQYLDSCGFAANMFLLRDEIQKRSAANIRESQDLTNPAQHPDQRAWADSGSAGKVSAK